MFIFMVIPVGKGVGGAEESDSFGFADRYQVASGSSVIKMSREEKSFYYYETQMVRKGRKS